jgi:hypothetical protein
MVARPNGKNTLLFGVRKGIAATIWFYAKHYEEFSLHDRRGGGGVGQATGMPLT